MGKTPTTRPEDRSAADWQEALFDESVRIDPNAAFGRGLTQDILWRKRVDLALRYVGAKGHMLDVGSGNGVVTHAVAERTDAHVVGIDVSGECVRYATVHNGHPRVAYYHISLEAFEPAAPFSLITMFEVLEHLDDPVNALRTLTGWLKPGGYLILSTPNRSSLNQRVKKLPGIRRLYTRLSGEDPDALMPGHVEEYGFDELRDMIRSAGLEHVAAGGAGLLMPFPNAIGPLSRNRRFVELNIRSGDWWPRLAAAAYMIARRPASG